RSYTPLPFLLVMFIFAHPTPQSLFIGFLFVLVGEGIRLWGVSIAGSETRTTGSAGGTNLITTGPFAHVRNPLYLGNILLYLGIGVMSDALFPWLVLGAVIVFFLQYYLIATLEEEYLARTFGVAFEEYTRQVGRFFPRLRKYRAPSGVRIEGDIQRGLRSETRTLQALFLISLALIVLWRVRS
ncbi:MAG: isoprenylcysteine carboxylmethyltransferase family protein, partial [Bacteroidota bacterium]